MFILLALSLGSACSESTTRRSDSGPEDAAGDAQPDDASDASVSLTDAETSESDSGVSVGDAAADADVEDAQADASPVEAGVDSSVVVDAGGDDMLDAGMDAATQPTDASVHDASVEPDGAVDTCGNGFFEEFERCDPAALNVLPELRCDCEDNDPCTVDRCRAGTSAAACDCECEHVSRHYVFGVGTCNDGNPCTDDVVHCASSGDTHCAQVCNIASCSNTPLASCEP